MIGGLNFEVQLSLSSLSALASGQVSFASGQA